VPEMPSTTVDTLQMALTTFPQTLVFRNIAFPAP
jgi:hypothetical protein